MARLRPSAAPTTSLVSGAVGGVLLLGSTFLPWSREGAGSAIALRRIGDLVLSGTVDALVPRWAGVTVYLIPLGGAVLLVGTGLGGRVGSVIGAVGVALAAAGTALALAALDRLPRSGVGGGTVAACAGAMLGTLGAGAGWHAHRPAVHDPRGDDPT
ncbi:hypothetical protein HC251_12070 [Iamia sp. SCSIO 61187]|uniref:hypothetical protein n=1 Tax=Iamia sp. SCSIO 61187 TaxID=2722752 RepID=UPI001C6350AA|nr:hypothetical protein [Iamia sp. SCSIO 61187]QYG93099.1 hypothetical protein HC251_12070 [Iamia sp. SCSIO 61187]